MKTPRQAAHTTETLRDPAAKLAREFANKQSLAARLILPGQEHSLLQRYNYFYLEHLLDRARANNVEIIFLYLPYFHGPEQPVAANFLLPYGPILKPTEILDDPGAWQNADHLNFAGANRLSVWMGHTLVGH